MPIFRELYIRGPAEAYAAAIADCTRALLTDWQRDTATEAEAGNAQYHFFTRAARPGVTGAIVFLAPFGHEAWRVAGLWPTGQPRFAVEEYNEILQDFALAWQPFADQHRLTVELTPATEALEDRMKPATANLFRTFARAVARHFGIYYPSERLLWNEFVTATHRENSDISPELLVTWLMELGVRDDLADEFARDYSSARELLKFYDGVAVPA